MGPGFDRGLFSGAAPVVKRKRRRPLDGYAGHPCLGSRNEDVDARDKRGHDETQRSSGLVFFKLRSN
jgi:hypothetical protein